MKLHQKLLLPLVAVFVAVLGYFYLAWIPRLRADAEADFQASISHHLDSVSEILVPLLLTSQLDVVHENMAALLSGNPDWQALVVTDREGRTVFPFRDAPLPQAGAGQVFFTIERPVQLGVMHLGRLSVIIDRTAALERQNQRFFELGAAFAGFAFVMLALALLVMEGAVLRPLRQLARASRALAARNFDAPLPAAGGDEVGELVEAFASMRTARKQAEATLAQRQHEAEMARQERELILSAPQEGICGLDVDGRLTFMNPAARHLLGWEGEEGVGTYLHENCHHHHADGTDYPPTDCPMYKTLADGQPREVAGEVYWRKDGSSFPVEYSVAAMRRGDAITGAVVVFRDITQRQAIEQALRQKTEALERSNTELEQFAYVASHDLREPLRMVTSYVSLLERRYGDKLDQDGHEFIAFARDGAERMNRLILDLLEYSRIGRIAPPKEMVSLRTIVDDALRPLQIEIDTLGAAVRVDPGLDDLPRIFGCRDELSRMAQNLIQNALKYHHPERPPQVDVRGRLDGDGVVLSVADNGIGIDPQYFERIFMIFQRLHTRGQYPGTGIGLAICKRIAEQHGGRIAVDSAPGLGSTFHVRLPLPGPAAD